MRFIFKTNYAQDINMARHGGDRFWYGCLILLMLAMPLLIDDFYLGEISYICILAIAGIGLMILTGYTGLASLGHAAFLGVGAYTQAFLLTHGVPFYLSIPIVIAVSFFVGAAIDVTKKKNIRITQNEKKSSKTFFTQACPPAPYN